LREQAVAPVAEVLDMIANPSARVAFQLGDLIEACGDEAKLRLDSVDLGQTPNGIRRYKIRAAVQVVLR